MQVVFITGNIGKDAELRTTQGGDDVLSFSMGVQNGFGRDAGTTWYRCSVWGQRGKSLAQHLRKGTKATVCGALKIGEYNGAAQYDVSVTEIDFSSPKQEGGQRQERQSDNRGGGGGGYASTDDLEDNIPFSSHMPFGDHRSI